MPNWCENTLTIKANSEQIKKIQEFVTGKQSLGFETKGEIFAFNQILPQPSEVNDSQDRESPYFWRNWNNKNWGTKWSAKRIKIIKQTTNQIVYSFETAWLPPEPVIYKLNEIFPEVEKIKLEYQEQGMGFAGHIICKKGQIIDASSWDLDYSDEEEMEMN